MKSCINCQKEFEPKRQRAKFCSDVCRASFHQNNKLAAKRFLGTKEVADVSEVLKDFKISQVEEIVAIINKVNLLASKKDKIMDFLKQIEETETQPLAEVIAPNKNIIIKTKNGRSIEVNPDQVFADYVNEAKNAESVAECTLINRRAENDKIISAAQKALVKRECQERARQFDF